MAGVTIRGLRGFTYRELDENIQRRLRGTSDRMCPLSTIYISSITGGNVDLLEMETALLVLCLLI